MATLVEREWYMGNSPIEALNNRLSDLKATLNQFLELIRTLEETAEEIAAFGRLSTDSSEILVNARCLIPQLYKDHEIFQSTVGALMRALSTSEESLSCTNDFNHQFISPVEDIAQACTTVNESIFQARRYVRQLTTVCQHQRQLIIESYLAQLADLILTLESTIQIIKNQVNCLQPTALRFDEFCQLIINLETNCREFQRSLELHKMVAERTPLTRSDTIETFETLREFISIVSAYVELAEMICIDLLS